MNALSSKREARDHDNERSHEGYEAEQEQTAEAEQHRTRRFQLVIRHRVSQRRDG